MLHYILRRLLAALPTLLGVSLVVFMMVRLLPGDPARIVAGLLASRTDHLIADIPLTSFRPPVRPLLPPRP